MKVFICTKAFSRQKGVSCVFFVRTKAQDVVHNSVSLPKWHLHTKGLRVHKEVRHELAMFTCTKPVGDDVPTCALLTSGGFPLV
jgi:hypothetical protein